MLDLVSILSCFVFLYSPLQATITDTGDVWRNHIREVKGRKKSPDFRVPNDPYVTGDGFRARADHVIDELNPTIDPNLVQEGDVIFIRNSHGVLYHFWQSIHRKIKHKYILITHNCDVAITEKQLKLLNSAKLYAWFAKNVTIEHPKLIPIPIGFENRYEPRGLVNIECFKNYVKRKNEFSKENLVYVNFDTATAPAIRTPILEILESKSFCTCSPRVPFETYLEKILSSKFVASPPGNGFDCFRTWECLLLGSYPIISSSVMDPLFADLPVVIVKNWDELSEELLEKKYVEFSKKEYSLEKLYIDYWDRMIRAHQKRAREGKKFVRTLSNF